LAVYNSVKHHFSLIQGPPGTGKTSIISNIVRVYKKLVLEKKMKEYLEEAEE
jgi:Ni2+-binding GTPase involved in maturation of urease and hydrogenase